MSVFCENLIEFRRKAGMSQEELAEKLDISRQTLSKWEQGQSEPGVEHLMGLCEVFDITPDQLLLDKCAQIGDNHRNVGSRNGFSIYDIFMLMLFATGAAIFIVYLCMVGRLASEVAFIGLGMMFGASAYILQRALRKKK